MIFKFQQKFSANKVPVVVVCAVLGVYISLLGSISVRLLLYILLFSCERSDFVSPRLLAV